MNVTLTDLIKSAERKIADPTTTPQTVEREKAIAHYLTAMQAEIEIKDETLATYRTENNELLLRLDRMEKVISEVQSENTELYLALCESGDMAREMSRRGERYETLPAMVGETVKLYTDDKEIYQTSVNEEVLYTTVVDKLIRHKWPEEKPPISGSRYLVLIDREYTSFIDILFWGGSDWVRFKHNDDRTCVEADDDVTHWWNLPEVKE